MKPELTKFLTDWLAWAEADDPRDHSFSGAIGLCSQCPEEYYTEFEALLARYFEGDVTPFNGKADHGYDVETIEAKTHRNPYRLVWVRHVLGEAQ